MTESSEVVDTLAQVSLTVVTLLNQAAAAHDLSLTQLRVLAILRDHEPKMAELAAHLGLERSSVSGLIDRAVKRGLVVRTPSSDDGRAVRVTFTEAGTRLADELTTELNALLSPLTSRLDPASQAQLNTLLKRLVE